MIHGELVEDKRRMIIAKGGIKNEDGTLLCTGEGKYIPLPPDELENLIRYAAWGDLLEKAHEKIRIDIG